MVERLHENSPLRDPKHPMRRILDNGVGGWLEDYDDDNLQEHIFLESATSNYLDLHGKDYGVKRKPGELVSLMSL